MEERYRGLLIEIQRYNDILKKQVDYNMVFYIDLEKYIKPEDPHKYLLLDDHHLNKEGNNLIISLLKELICAFIENEMGVDCFENKNDRELSVAYFHKSYTYYPNYLDNLYNLLVLSYENNDIELVRKNLNSVKRLKVKDHPIAGIFQHLNKS